MYKLVLIAMAVIAVACGGSDATSLDSVEGEGEVSLALVRASSSNVPASATTVALTLFVDQPNFIWSDTAIAPIPAPGDTTRVSFTRVPIGTGYRLRLLVGEDVGDTVLVLAGGFTGAPITVEAEKTTDVFVQVNPWSFGTHPDTVVTDSVIGVQLLAGPSWALWTGELRWCLVDAPTTCGVTIAGKGGWDGWVAATATAPAFAADGQEITYSMYIATEIGLNWRPAGWVARIPGSGYYSTTVLQPSGSVVVNFNKGMNP